MSTLLADFRMVSLSTSSTAISDNTVSLLLQSHDIVRLQ